MAQEFAALAKDYGIGSLTGDQYAGQWVAGAFQDAGIDYRASSLPESQLYLEGLPHFMRGLVSIPDQPQLIRELRLLERRTARSGRDSVDHGQAGSDDFANVLFGALYLAAGRREQHVPMCPPFVWWVPRNFPTSDGDMQNPAIGQGVYSGGQSAMERFAREREA
jgi:hypothetical protein